MNGLVDLKSLAWDSPRFIPISPTERDPLSYNRDLKLLQHKNDRKIKVHCNINRICEVEDAVPEWILTSERISERPRMPIDHKFYENFRYLDTDND